MGLGELLRRIAFLLQRKRRMEEIDEEMHFHAELRTRSLREAGMVPQTAASAAKRQLGNRTYLKEAAWDVWSFATLESLWLDVKFCARVLRSSPGFTALAVLTLALGIGATTAMFSVIDNVLLEPFPYANQNRLVSLVIHDAASSEAGGRSMFPAAEFLDIREQNRVFDDVMGVGISRALWTTGGAPESVNAPLVTGNAFEFLGVSPLLGRFATPADIAGASPVCVMSYSFWQNRFAGDPRVIGKTLTLDGSSRTVIGVMPPRFIFWSADVWIPTQLKRDQAGFPPPWFYLLGRLKPGLTVKTADPQIQILAEHVAQAYRPNLYPSKFEASLESFADASIGKFRRTLFTLLAAVGLLLLIACVNVANLLLARASAREREFAIRSSLGAGWWRVARQLFTESLALASLGAASGCLFAWAGLKLLVAVLPQDTFPEEAVIDLNLRVLTATVAIAVCTALFFGLVPVMSGLHRDVNAALKAGGREHSGFKRARLRNLLVIAEVAVSLVLLAGAGVTMRSFIRERTVQLGLNPQHLLTAQVFRKGQRTVEQQVQFEQELTSALRRLPGVLDFATTTDFLPFGGALTEFAIPGKPHSEQNDGQFAMIDPDLFRTIQVPLLRGRNLALMDIFAKHKVAVVNQAFVEKFFQGENPIGQLVGVTTLQHLPEAISDPRFEIVGVIADFKNRGLRQPVRPEVFLPSTIAGLGGFSLIMRTAGAPKAFEKVLEGTALTLDGSTVVRHMRTMEDGLENEEYAKPRFGLEIFSVFAVLGVLLVSVGLYSVMSYTVAQRRRELGIRLALGATAAEVQTMVIGTGMRLVAAGIVAGVLASFLLLRFLQSQIWGVTVHEPVTFVAVAGILVLTGIAACYFPSLLASRVDPAFTLRSE